MKASSTPTRARSRHKTVAHSLPEYVRHGYIHTNTIEGYFSIFKRGMRGVYSIAQRSICTAI
jgi:hypothetical protein